MIFKAKLASMTPDLHFDVDSIFVIFESIRGRLEATGGQNGDHLQKYKNLKCLSYKCLFRHIDSILRSLSIVGSKNEV